MSAFVSLTCNHTIQILHETESQHQQVSLQCFGAQQTLNCQTARVGGRVVGQKFFFLKCGRVVVGSVAQFGRFTARRGRGGREGAGMMALASLNPCTIFFAISKLAKTT